MIITEEQWRNSAIHIHMSILPQTSLLSRLPHDIEQSSMYYTVDPFWLSILNIAGWSFFLEFFCLFFRFHYKYGHTVFCHSLFDLSHLVNGLKVHSCCHRWQELLLLYGWIVFYCVYVCKYHIYIIFSLPIHPSMNTYVVVMS